jgi:hypothetical protein
MIPFHHAVWMFKGWMGNRGGHVVSKNIHVDPSKYPSYQESDIAYGKDDFFEQKIHYMKMSR